MSDTEDSETVEVGVENYHDGKGNEVMRQPTLTTLSNCSSSSDVSSTISTSSESDQDDDNSYDDDDDDTFELAKITKQTLSLPKGLCENASIFREFFSLETWKALPIQVQNHLQQFLPRFTHLLPPQLDAIEQTRTLSMLFNGRLERFGQTPLFNLQRELERGNYRPDILKLRQSIAKSKRREQRFRQCEHISQLAKQLFLSRQRLVDAAYQSSPDTVIKVQQRTLAQPKPTQLYADNKLSAIRARKRFHGEIFQMIEKLGFKPDELSADEDEMDKLTGEELKDDALVRITADELIEPSKATGNLQDRCIYSTLFKREKEIDDEDACRQQQKSKQLRLCNKNFRHYLREHKRRKLTEPTLPEFETSDIRLRDVCARAQMGGNFKRIFNIGKTAGRKAKTQSNQTNSNVNFINNKTDASPTSALTTSINNNTNNNNLSDNISSNIIDNSFINPSISGTSMKFSEPPALVPIQPRKKVDLYNTTVATGAIASQKELLLDQISLMGDSGSVTTSHINNNLTDILEDDQTHFNILDNEVELQQEEVETFAGNIGEETIPAFVMANDVTPTPTATPTPISTSTNFARQTRYNTNQMISATNDISSMPLPKLEPISSSPSLKNHAIHKVLFSPTKVIPTTATINPSMNGNVNNGISTNNINNNNGNSDLIQETHSSYFSLIRDFFCCTPNYRMHYDELKSKIDTWLRNPITALNEWYTLADNWSLLLKSAINFLIGDFHDLPEEYVPYIEYKSQIHIYQWIGAGRDSDNRLTSLCQTWMEKRCQQQYEQTNAAFNQSNKMKWDNTALTTKSPLENDDSGSAPTIYDCSINENNGSSIGNVGSITSSATNITPLPPRFPTTWKVKPATPSEIIEFQRQERERFEKPHRAYTYRMHGYESVVGPVKGIYTAMLAMTKARGHSMMVGDRPNFVTILTLVRDATARLPNGEGTRTDISELLKCSQYINRDAAENVLQTIVSGALDRMHAEHDPCVRYDAKRKIWIYLHRNRSEEEFERLHQQNQCLGKVKKVVPRKSRATTNTKTDVDTLGTSVGSGGPEISAIETAATLPAQPIQDHNIGLPIASVTLPALVPSTPLVTNANAMHIPQQKYQIPSQQQVQLLMNSKCLPVPPLKYNIPSHIIPPASTSSMQYQQQQQQKSLLKTSTIRQENLVNNNYNNSSNCNSRSGDLNASIIVQNGPPTANRPFSFPISPLNKMPINNNSSNNSITAKSTASTTPIIVATPQGLQTIHVTNANNESFTGSTPNQLVTTGTLAETATTIEAVTKTTATTLSGKRMTTTFNKPIIINQFTQQQLQQKQQQQQQHNISTIVNSNYKMNVNASISQQNQSTNVAIAKGLGGSKVNVTIPQSISANAFISNASSSHSPSSCTIIVQTTISRPTVSIATQNNNFLRLVSASSTSPLSATDNSAVKSITSTTSSPGQAVVSRQRVLTSANLITTSALPSLILHNKSRLTAASTSAKNVIEQHQQQQQQQQHSTIKAPPKLEIIKNNNNNSDNSNTSNKIITIGNAVCSSNGNEGNLNDAAPTTTSVLKMSAQAFANLQQKQQQQQQSQQLQRMTLKTGNAQTLTVTVTKAPQKLMLGNTTVLATPLTHTGQKNIILQQLPIVVARSTATTTTPIATTNVNVTTTTTTMTKPTAIPTAPSAPATSAVATTSRIHTINASSLTPQQQRILIHNLKQQQPQSQQNNTTTNILSTPVVTTTQTPYKTVQIVNANSYQQQQLQQQHHQQQQQQLGKTLTLMVPQDNRITTTTTTTQAQSANSNVARIIKTTQPQLKQIDATATNATRMITNSGQIITLENLLQRKGTALRIASGSTVPAAAATTTTTTTKMITTNITNVQQHQHSQQLQQQHQVQQQHNISTETLQKQQPTSQYAVMSVAQPVTNNVINIVGTTLTLGQRILTTKVNDNSSNLAAASISSTTSNTISPQTSIPATSVAIGRAFMPTSNKVLTKANATPIAATSVAAIGTVAGGNANNIRVINAAGQTSHLNLANCLQGKQVIFAANNPTLQKQLATTTFKNQAINSIVMQQQPRLQQSQQQQSQQQNPNIIIGGHAIRLQQSNIPSKTVSAINVGTSSSTITTTTTAAATPIGSTIASTTRTSLAYSSTSTAPNIQTVLMGNQMLKVHQMPQIRSAVAAMPLTVTTAAVTTTAATATIAATAIAKTATATIINHNNNTLEMSTQKNAVLSGGAGTTSKAIFIGGAGQTLRLQQTNVNISPTINTLNKNIVIQRNNQQNNSLGSCKVTNNASRTASITLATTTTTTTTSTSTLPNRVVLAVQGGGQIFLSPTLQGGNINLKNLHNLKLISLMNPNSQIKCVTTNAAATNAVPTVTASVPATTTSPTTIAHS